MIADRRVQIARRVAENPLWYHTIDLPEEVSTPGWFDLRPIVDRMPWPEVQGKRCLDVGTYDGFLAFELERRGASEVVATDIPDHRSWDWPADMRASGPDALAALAGPQKGLGFAIAHELLGSSVKKVEISAYDLSPDRVGMFDVVVCGTLMLHLRDPVAALEAIRSVCAGQFLSAEQIELGLGLRNRGRPVAALNGAGELCQWWTPTPAGHRQMLFAAGFDVQRATRPYSVRFGSAHPPRTGLRARRSAFARRALAGADGVPHAAVLATPRL